MPWAGTMRCSIPRAEPSHANETPRARKISATASDDVDFFLVEFFFDGIVSHVVLALGPSQSEAKVIRDADDRHDLG